MIDQLLMDQFTSGAYFSVVLGGNPLGMSGRFTSVSGLGMQFEYETVREGGSMYPRYFLKHAVPQTLVLEQGTVTSVDTFSAWVNMVNMGMSVPLAGIITLNDHRGIAMRTWTIAGAHIVKYVGPNLDSNNVQLAVNRIELLYGGCT
ncbi:MAG: phage tail protein [Clostridia bacterium]|nr:phage tail protein [Clostridia bacterium]